MVDNARIGDVFVGKCCCHGCKHKAGIIVTGADSVTTENSPDSRVGDIGIGYCKHPTILVSGSDTTTIENSPDSRCIDAVAGCIVGAMVTCADTVSNNN